MTWGRPLALIVALVLGTVATFAGYVQAQPDSYASTAVLSLSPRDSGVIGSDDLTLAVSRYVAYLSAPATSDQVAAVLGQPPSAVAAMATVIQQPATVNLTISVVGTSPWESAEIANALAAAGVRESVDDSQVVADLIVPAVIPDAPSGPPRQLLFLLGALGALCIGVLAWLALGYLRLVPEVGFGPATLNA